VHFQTCHITTSKCISKIARLRAQNLLDHSLGVHLYFHTISGWWHHATRTQTARQDYSATHPMVSQRTLWARAVIINRCRKWGRLQKRIPGHDELQKLHPSSKARHVCSGRRAGNDRVYILYNEMMSMYPRSSQIYTACRWVHLGYPCIAIYVCIESVR
jgi:hypothetical protein